MKKLLLLGGFVAFFTHGFAQGTAFTYHGRLNSGASPANGLYDFQFTLHGVASGGLPLEEVPVLTNSATAVSEGLFTVTLDFGNEFSGNDRWIEIGVRTNGGGAFNILSPRQAITPTPYAMYAPNAGYANSASAGALLGTIPSSAIAPGTITSAMLTPGAISGLGSPDGSPANALTVNTNGYIGIGSTNPTAALSLSGGPTQIVPRVLAQIQDGFGSFTNLAAVRCVAVKGNLLAVGAGADDAVTLVNLANPSNPVWTNSIRDGGLFTNRLDQVTSVAFSSTSNLLAIAAVTDSTVTLVDLNNPGSPVKRAELRDGVGSFLELNGATSVAFSSNLLAIAASLDDAVTLVDVSNPANPVYRIAMKDGQFGFNDLDGACHVAFSGNLLAIAALGDDAVSLVDVSNPASPVLRAVLKDGVGGYNDLAEPQAVAFSGNLLAIAAYGDNAVTLVDVSNPALPIRRATMKAGIGGFDALNGPVSVAFSSNLLAICTLDFGMTLVDVSNPANPQMRGLARNGVGGADRLNSLTSVALAGTNFVVGSANANAFTILAPESQAMGLSSAEWVGIGVTAPQAALHVVGDVLAEGNMRIRGNLLLEKGDVHIRGDFRLEGDDFVVQAPHVAIGTNNTASGSYATVIGQNTTASGDYSIAMGSASIATGQSSVAIGSGASAGGFAATALGNLTYAGGYSSTALGDFTTASGDSSTAMGRSTTASGNRSSALGNSTTASGSSSTAMGTSTTASGISSTAMGYFTTASGDYSTAMGYDANATHTASFVWSDSSSFPGMSSVGNHTFNVRATGGVHFHGGSDASLTGGGFLILGPTNGANLVLDSNEIMARNNGATATLTLNNNGGNVVVGGTIIGSSDRNLKENFAPVDARAVLDKVLQLPITEWNYKATAPQRHVGPMAQDFHAAFGLGPDDKHIATVDADGVALVAIQGLNQKLEVRSQKSESSIQELKAENAELKARLEKLERLLKHQAH